MLKNNIFIIATILIIYLIIFRPFKSNNNQQHNLCLLKCFECYKQEFMSKDGRIIDYDKNGITTSEGQSYIMIRSLPMGDQATFDLAYKWAKDNLQRRDKLFSWLWGKNSNGEYKILDENSATDADVDIAFALVLAYEKWGKQKYLDEAIPIINSIWDKETRKIDDCLVLMPGVKQNFSDKLEINPSYFSPYAFRFFQKYDPLHGWSLLIDSSYDYLDKVMAKTQTGLPPNWFLIKNEEIVLEDSEKSDFSYDAIRVFMRIYLDYIRTGEKRALPILSKSKIFIDKWNTSKVFYFNYKVNGELRDKTEFLGAISSLLPVINMYDSDAAKEIYKKKLEPYFANEKQWKSKTDYYGKNLVWFGCYLYNKDSEPYKRMHRCRIKGY